VSQQQKEATVPKRQAGVQQLTATQKERLRVPQAQIAASQSIPGRKGVPREEAQVKGADTVKLAGQEPPEILNKDLQHTPVIKPPTIKINGEEID